MRPTAQSPWRWVRRLAPIGAAVAGLSLFATSGVVAHSESRNGDDSQASVTYKGPVRYLTHCESGGPPKPGTATNTSTTAMNSDDSQEGCQFSYDGGLQVDRSDCSVTRNDEGTWNYRPYGAYAQYDHGFAFNGTYTMHSTLREGIYSGTETFRDPGVGTVHQTYQARVTYTPGTCKVASAYDWYVVTKATGQLSFLSGTAGTPITGDGDHGGSGGTNG